MSIQTFTNAAAKHFISEQMNKNTIFRILHKELEGMPYRDIVFMALEAIHEHEIPEVPFNDLMEKLRKPAGYGMPKDYAEAVQWHQEAILIEFQRVRHKAAQLHLRRLKCEVRGMPQDFAEALQWYQEPAENGDVDAQYKLGEMYFWGCGVQQNYEQAAHWYRKAADGGDARAQADLGWLCLHGRGVPPDDALAVHWFQLAADGGHAGAQFILYEGMLQGKIQQNLEVIDDEK